MESNAAAAGADRDTPTGDQEQGEPTAATITPEQLYATVVLLRAGFSFRAVVRLLKDVKHTTLWRRLQVYNQEVTKETRRRNIEQTLEIMKRRVWLKLQQQQHQLMLMLELRQQLRERAEEQQHQLDQEDPRLQGCREFVHFLQLQVEQMDAAIQREAHHIETRQADTRQAERDTRRCSRDKRDNGAGDLGSMV